MTLYKRDRMTLVKSQLRNCAGWENDEISQDRKAALDYYFRRARGDEVQGRSTVVAGDVSASVEANLAQMLDAFSNAAIVEFDAIDELDEDQARLESDVVIHYVMKKQNGFFHLATAIKEALLLRNGFMKLWVEERVETRTRVFENVEPVAVDELLKQTRGSLVSHEGTTATIRVETRTKKFRAEACQWVYYPKTWHSFDLQDCPFVAERHVETRSALRARGFPAEKVERAKAIAVNKRDDVGNARNVRGIVAANTNTPDRSQDLIEWFECFVLMDTNGDGIAERRRYSFVYEGAVELEDIPWSHVPYAAGAAMINPHRLTAISQYDKLLQTQDEHTGLKRALYDNINTVTKNRIAYFEDSANPDDVGDGRPNGGIRVKRKPGMVDVRQAIMGFQVPDNSANILANIESIKRERSELGGAALELQSGAAQIGGERMGSQGLDRAYSVMEQLASMMTQFIACTLIRETFLLAHTVMRENFTEPVPFKRNGKWISPIPAQWQPREMVTVKIGMSPGERARMAAALGKMLDSQLALADKGLDEVLVNATRFYRTLMAWARVNDIRNPEQYFIDPESPEARRAFALKTKAAQQDAGKRQNLMERAIGKEEAVVALDKYKHDSSLVHKYWSDVLDSEVEEARIVGDSTTKLLLARKEPGNDGNGKDKARGARAPGKRATKQAPRGN